MIEFIVSTLKSYNTNLRSIVTASKETRTEKLRLFYGSRG